MLGSRRPGNPSDFDDDRDFYPSGERYKSTGDMPRNRSKELIVKNKEMLIDDSDFFCEFRGIEEPSPGEYKIFIIEQALKAIWLHAKEGLPDGVTGLLLGGLYHDPSRSDDYVEVHHVFPSNSVFNEDMNVKNASKILLELEKLAMKSFPNELVIGWYHTHPDKGIFFSDSDTVIHNRLYSENTNIALVLDPVMEIDPLLETYKNIAFFYWRGSDIEKSSGYFAYKQRHEESISPLDRLREKYHARISSKERTAELERPSKIFESKNVDRPLKERPATRSISSDRLDESSPSELRRKSKTRESRSGVTPDRFDEFEDERTSLKGRPSRPPFSDKPAKVSSEFDEFEDERTSLKGRPSRPPFPESDDDTDTLSSGKKEEPQAREFSKSHINEIRNRYKEYVKNHPSQDIEKRESGYIDRKRNQDDGDEISASSYSFERREREVFHKREAGSFSKQEDMLPPRKPSSSVPVNKERPSRSKNYEPDDMGRVHMAEKDMEQKPSQTYKNTYERENSYSQGTHRGSSVERESPHPSGTHRSSSVIKVLGGKKWQSEQKKSLRDPYEGTPFIPRSKSGILKANKYKYYDGSQNGPQNGEEEQN